MLPLKAFSVFLFLGLAPTQASDKSIIVVNDVADPVSLDPHREFDASSENIINQIYDGLVRMDFQGKIEPALAKSWKRLDERTMEFHLRENVFFHNGDPFTAESVRFSLKRQLDPKTPAPNAGLVNTIENVEVVDSHTVRIKTKEPDGVLLNKLPLFVRILPERYTKEIGDKGFAEKPVGTGPFMFERWVQGEQVELKKNPHYWMKGVPAVDKVAFRFMPLEKQLEALLSGEVDMVTDLSGLDTMKVAKNPKTKVVKAKNFYTVSALINSRKEPFSDQRLREALAYAVDVNALIRYAAKGNASRLNTLTMPGEFGHHSNFNARQFNFRKSRNLVKQAGFGGGLKIKVLVREEVRNFALIILKQLEDAGIFSEAEYVGQDEVFRRIVLPNIDPKQEPWDGDLVITHYVDPTAHVYFPYSILIYSQGAYSLSRDREFDEIFIRMTATVAPEEQKKFCFQLEEIIHKKVLAISFLQVIRPYGMRKEIEYQPHVTGMLDFRTLQWR